MPKKHILNIGLFDFAFDSVAPIATIMKAMEKGIQCDWKHNPSGNSYYQASESDQIRGIKLEMNQEFRPLPKAKPEKVLALPAPKRGTIRCICDKSDVSPRQSCPHCGRPFSESHNRTHGSTATQSNLRLI